MRLRRFVIALLAAFLATNAEAQRGSNITEQYREVAGRLIGASLVDEEGWAKLTHLTTRIGPRLSGSDNLNQAVQWAVQAMRAEGLDNPRLQPVKVPHWVRGRESADIVAPISRPMAMLGLGGSVATPADGIMAPVVVVRDFAELDRLGPEKIRGAIVLYDMEWRGYGQTVPYRSSGASRAARHGAVASLVRSVTGSSLYTPHTGNMSYDPNLPRIPAAAITVEDAAWIRRMSEGGAEVRVHLRMEARMMPVEADSANVIAEIRGREWPDEVVVFGGHFDSWDVGQGAHDDGAACIAAWQALTLMKKLGLRPRRTVRVVLWTNEENGGRGGAAYRDSLGSEIEKHVAAIEMDGGAERPVGYGFTIQNIPYDDPGYLAASGRLKEIGRLLDAIDAGTITTGGGGADIAPLMRDGVPGLGLNTVGTHYFDWHHTNADTLDKVDPQNFRRAIASLAVMAYVLADMPDRLKNGSR